MRGDLQDRFRELLVNVLNETLGLSAGDELLRALGPRLHGVLRPGDTVARSPAAGTT